MKDTYKPIEKNGEFYILKCGMVNVVFPDLNNKLVYKEILYRAFDDGLLYFNTMEDATIFCNFKNSL